MKQLGILLFPEFELLDLAGPIEMFGRLKDKLNLVFISETSNWVSSSQGLVVRADIHFQNTPPLDFLLIPGGLGTRQLVNHSPLIDWIHIHASQATLVMSVCTGAALLAKSGLLDGRTATSNKQAFSWVMQQGPAVRWMKHARWVEDGKFFTSAGVAAGIDMSLAVIEKCYGRALAEETALATEYVWNRNALQDPFAE